MRRWIALGTLLAAAVGCSEVLGLQDWSDGGPAAAGSGSPTSASGSTSGSGGDGACTDASDCPGPEGACGERVCEKGTCSVTNTPAGTSIGAQTSGDCARVVCDGAGALTTAFDPTDVPSDGNDCTLDACTATGPTHAPAPEQTPCGTDGTLACDDDGQCTGCNSPPECGEGSECVAYGCSSGICSVTLVPAGQGDLAQTDGDCLRTTCNGSGGVTTVVDDSDEPEDGNPCTTGTCSDGVAYSGPAPQGTACNGGTCDGQGSCSACGAPTDCGVDGPCISYGCEPGGCTVAHAPSGTDAGDDVPGDCQRRQCNGSGGVEYVAANDAPDDGNPCTDEVCTGGVLETSFVEAFTACGTDQTCDGAGNCVGCTTNAQCTGGNACVTYQCVQSACHPTYAPLGAPAGDEEPGDCLALACDGGGSIYVVPANDPPASANECWVANCYNGNPFYTEARDGTPCASGYCSGGLCQSP